MLKTSVKFAPATGYQEQPPKAAPTLQYKGMIPPTRPSCYTVIRRGSYPSRSAPTRSTATPTAAIGSPAGTGGGTLPLLPSPARRSPENLYTFGYHLGQVYLCSRSSSYLMLSQASDCLPCSHVVAPLIPLGIIS